MEGYGTNEAPRPMVVLSEITTTNDEGLRHVIIPLTWTYDPSETG